jgi:hypothetical protein
MYKKVPTNKLIEIIEFLCVENMVDEKLREEIVAASKVVLKQNYFQFSDIFYLQ